MNRPAEIRRLLGIVACPSDQCRAHAVRLGFRTTVKGVDTIPDERTGQCFWCATQLVAPRSRSAARLEALPVPPAFIDGRCAYCGDELVGSRKRRYCGPQCKQAFWVRFTEGGRRWMREQSNGRKAA